MRLPINLIGPEKYMFAFTDYPIVKLGDVTGKKAPVRKVWCVGYDQNKYVYVLVPVKDHALPFLMQEIKSGYLYSKKGRFGSVPNFSQKKLNNLPTLDQLIWSIEEFRK
jgi:hypothetical protein